jgi:2-polyprenyl-3-methyl-5-hydroxy-6-metoxy-1,4-benzoquinol methylase
MTKEISDYSMVYDPDLDFDRWYTTLSARRITRSLGVSDRILELGSATGLLTQALAGSDRRFVCVERSDRYVAHARTRSLPGVQIVHCTIEEFQTEDTFDHVLAINVLHEVENQRTVVEHLMQFLRPNGQLHVTLPNPRSLHRLSALGSGMIEDLCAMSERGEMYQTRRLQYAEEFVAAMAELGLYEIVREPILAKPLHNAAMEQLSDELIEAYAELACALPEFGAMNYFVFRRCNG